MTIVYISEDEITITGHSNSGAEGHDLVCSACSILMWTAVEALKGKSTVTMGDSGYCHISLQDIDSRPILNTIATGYRLLAEKVPEFVKVKEDS